MSTEAKICGIRGEAALEAALNGGARWIGLVFVARSPRCLDISRAAELAALARGRIKIVALVADADDAEIDTIVRGVGPDVLQLHGHETMERVAAIRARFGVPVIKAVGVATAADVAAAFRYHAPGRLADLVLLDAKAPPGSDLKGGHGAPFDWMILSAVPIDVPYMLAGGLNPGNVRDCILKTGAPAVDVSSGVETAPGEKSPELIQRFLQAVKTAKQRL
ncbi:MAG: phosphoribosylanthranilate isomerase [Hyphomicrobiaceae bacterium]